MTSIPTLASTLVIEAGLLSGSTSVGTAVVAVIVLIVAGYFASRYKLTEIAQQQTKGAQEAASEWRDNYLAERSRADDFEKRYQQERLRKHEALTELATEKLKTDQTFVLQALEAQMQALVEFHGDFVAAIADLRTDIKRAT